MYMNVPSMQHFCKEGEVLEVLPKDNPFQGKYLVLIERTGGYLVKEFHTEGMKLAENGVYFTALVPALKHMNQVTKIK